MGQEEVKLDDTTKIITKTNDKGVIQYVNEDFVKISGYSEKELLGKAHNIIRHPDVPRAIFEDMWGSIQAGIPWRGVIKNKTKSGGYYWVDSLVSPSFDDSGKIIGYISVRKKASDKQIEAATRLFKKIKEGKKLKTTKTAMLNRVYRFGIEKRLWFLNMIFTSMMVFWVLFSLYKYKTEYDFYQKKIAGSDYLILLANFTQKISIHRALSAIYLSGDSSYEDRIAENGKSVDELIEKISSLNSKDNGNVLSSELWEEVISEWKSIKSSKRLTVISSIQKHSDLIRKSLLINNELSDRTNLNLDLFPNTVYIEHLTTRILPLLVESLGQLKVTSALVFSRPNFSDSDRLKIKGISSEILIYSDEISKAFEFTKRYNQNLDAKLLENFEKLSSDTKNLSRKIDAMLLGSSRSENIPAFKEMTNLTNSYIEFNDSLHLLLDSKLKQKMFEMKLKIYFLLIIFAFVIVVFHFLVRTITRSIHDSVHNSIADLQDYFKQKI